jgi:3-hydroxy acid dehydrogenase / malonic semialdehyde reductase
MSKKIALITGATSGIGQATAELLLQNEYKVIITGRREDRLNEFQSRYSQNDVHTLNFDIRNEQSVLDALNTLPEDWKNIDVLVNNAGLALGLSQFYDGSTEHWDTMIDTNVKGLLYISRAVSRGMKERKSGHIVNIGSIAGKEVYNNGNVYCATKHAVDALTKAMRLELATFGVKVTGVHPGAVETEFSIVRFEGDEQRAKTVYQGFENLVAADIADAVYYAISRPAHVNINDLVIMPTAQPQAGLIHRNS